MKKVSLLLLFFAGAVFSSVAQENNKVEVPAEFPGGREAMVQYLSENIKYPDKALSQGVNGKCYARFVISSAGNVSDVQIVQGVSDCPECDAEVIRVITAMPDWIPAMQNGKVVNSYYTLPVVFHTDAPKKTKKQLRKEARARHKNGDF